MSISVKRARSSLLERVGTAERLDAYVTGLVFLNDGTLAAALGDGRIAFIGRDPADPPRFARVHDGACLSLAVDGTGGRILTGGDDGRLAATHADGRTGTVLAIADRWIEPIATAPATGLVAAAAGRTVHLLAGDGTEVAVFEHANTVSGLSFDPKGRRLAASHYGGVSLWWAKGGDQAAKRLNWPGSHLGLTWSPDGKHIITAMQENALHGWRMADAGDLRMSGYPAAKRMKRNIPIGRSGSAQDIANGILFLSSDASSYMNGSELVIDGGVTAA